MSFARCQVQRKECGQIVDKCILALCLDKGRNVCYTPGMNAVRLEQLRTVYTESLRQAVYKYPQHYPWAYVPTLIRGNDGVTTLPQLSVEKVATKMLDSVAKYGTIGGISIDSHGWKEAAKQLGIKNTKKAWNAWLAEA